ncbi:MAG TPA: rhomboid family intramembrane serine protease [Burkholderiaceae bacterium]|nr:rhomboid family intramembrane serine protease [Burkholderiaceae bacterium]
MLPYHDENETQRPAYVTLALIALNAFAWLTLQGAGATLPLAASVCNFGLIPGELTGSLPPGTGFPMGHGLVCVTEPGRQTQNLVTSMFMHGSWMHLLGNMWFLWLFGNNVEDSMTRPRFVAFYLLCGLAAAFAQVLVDPTSRVPMVGASGAISGVLGAYLVLFPRVRVYVLVIFFSVALPAWAMILYWALLQLFGGVTTAVTAQSGGVAFWAHLGGFVAGVALVKAFVRPDRLAAHVSHHWRPRREGWRR